MELWKRASPSGASFASKPAFNPPNTMVEKAQLEKQDTLTVAAVKEDVDLDLKEVYFLMLHFLSSGPCQRTFAQFLPELLEHELLPRRYHAWFSRTGVRIGNVGDDGLSLPLSYSKVADRYPHIEKDHLVKLLKQLLLQTPSPMRFNVDEHTSIAADAPTLLGSGSFSLLECERNAHKQVKCLPVHLRWPHMQANQLHGLSLREIGGGFAKHHRAPSIRSACYAIAKPSTMVQRMQNIKRLRGHRNAVYCAIFDRSGRFVITGSDDRLVKIWSMETAFCLASCRGHEGDITDLAVSSNNALVASASNDFVIRVWRLPDGLPISVLQGHTGAVTAIAFSPRPSSIYQLLSSSDDGTCRLWDARHSQCQPRIYVPKPSDVLAGKSNGLSSNGPSSSNGPQGNQILCCAFNANGTLFVTGSSDTYARVWSACKFNTDDSEQPIHELDILSAHEDDVNYVQFSGCAVGSRSSLSDALKEENFPKFKNSWFCHDNIVTCSRDGSARIWVPQQRRSHGKSLRWSKSYHLKVPPPPLPPQPPRGGPRQRILPTPRGVNMIIWSLDNRFVLAAIMDCRICVWNAVEGKLVHSLTGHTESSYVLDVHPFNPRIAMSAGYDGRTIVWDIWEGIAIRTYEIGRFKLVDGKFSPDGTSIVLSDDVGQIYFLNTGQGESQKDAKYDQFFLGDYRPLIRDAAGNVLDQETQLVPHWRNMQDPLCDSSMIPYPEPYQTMFQKRRLGALGVEWRPSSIKFAVGPDISFGQDYQMPPLEDLDRIIEPAPEFIDAMFWEPDNEVISDDADSEYNVAEEWTSEGEQGSISCSSPSDPDCSVESDIEHSQKDGCHRSRRRKHKTEIESMTSSGRRVKKRHLDECGGSAAGSNRAKISKSSRKVSKRKSPKAKSARPQRVAARNALHMFSRFNGVSTDEDDDDSGDNSSNSESDLQDSNIQTGQSSRYMQNVKSTEEERLVSVKAEDRAKPQELPESQTMTGNRKKLVLKLSLRDSKKPVTLTDNKQNGENQDNIMDSSSRNKDPGDEEQYAIEAVQDLDFARTEELVLANRIDKCPHNAKSDAFASSCNGNLDEGDKDWSGSDKCGNCSSQKVGEVNGTSHSQELVENPPPKLRRLKIKATGIRRDQTSPSKLKFIRTVDDLHSDGGDVLPKSPSYQEENQNLGVHEKLGGSSTSILIHNVHEGERLCGAGADLDDFDGVIEENVSNGIDYRGYGIGFPEPATDAIRRTRSVKIKATSREPNSGNHKLRFKVGHESVGTSKGAGDEILSPERILKLTVRSRSARSRRGVYYNNDASFSLGRSSNQSSVKLSWLMLSINEDGCRYIPQLGDEVVYLRQGHQEFIESIGSRERGPGSSIKGRLRAVEICRVEKLEYDTVASGDSCCKIMLKFVDPSSLAFGRTLDLTLPELIDFPDFVVEKTRYDAAMSRNWTHGDKCMVWWRNENGEDGSWWEGKIIYSQPKSPEFSDSPWERYLVRYPTNPPEEHRHSPWELHDPEIPWEQAHIDLETRDELLARLDRLENSRNQDHYGIKKLNEAACRVDFINRFPVALYPEIVRSRLENNYYRSLDAVKHDIKVMTENAQSYFLRSGELSSKMKRLSDWFKRNFFR